MNTGIDEKTKKIIVGTIKLLIPEAKIYLFGSRARGDFQESSDIDIAVDAGERLERVAVAEVREMLNASNILKKIEVVDVHSVSESMQKNIYTQGILWSDDKKNINNSNTH